MLLERVAPAGFLLEEVDLDAPFLKARSDRRKSGVGGPAIAPFTRPLPAAGTARGHARLARVEASESEEQAKAAQFRLRVCQGVACSVRFWRIGEKGQAWLSVVIGSF